jgi:hypothetical protein
LTYAERRWRPSQSNLSDLVAAVADDALPGGSVERRKSAQHGENDE